MSGKRSAPPWDFFHDASITSLQSFELSRLNHAANLRREIAALLDQWVSDNSEAMLARWVREHRTMARPIQPDAIANPRGDSSPPAITAKHDRRSLAVEEHSQLEPEVQSLLIFEPLPPIPVLAPRSNRTPTSAPQSAARQAQPVRASTPSRSPR